MCNICRASSNSIMFVCVRNVLLMFVLQLTFFLLFHYACTLEITANIQSECKCCPHLLSVHFRLLCMSGMARGVGAGAGCGLVRGVPGALPARMLLVASSGVGGL